ncbi:MAG: hypothetical protein RIQ60_3871 [Pseudomonadota bacterium]|jgi:carboxymethylenebutenolidase
MIVHTEHLDIPAPADQGGGVMRCFLARPQAPGPWPGIVFYSDIFQLTGPMLRACVRLAGHGYTVLAPEIYRRIEPAGSVIAFDDAGRSRGLDNAARTPVAQFDADCRLALDFLAAHPAVAPGRLGAAGFCIGGHLALRAALQPDVRATTCFYATGVHSGKLGSDDDAGTLAALGRISGRVLLVWGERDPHIPPTGRAVVEAGLQAAGVDWRSELHPEAEHAFMRDEGPRFDPAAADAAWGQALAFFAQAFAT